MKKILIFLCIGAATLGAMERKNPFVRSMSVPGALKPSSEAHSPTKPSVFDQALALQNARLIETYGTAIKNAATRKLSELVESGKPLGSKELSEQLSSESKKVHTEYTNNEKNKKPKAPDDEKQYKAHRLALLTNDCVLHLADAINAGITYNNEINHP